MFGSHLSTDRLEILGMCHGQRYENTGIHRRKMKGKTLAFKGLTFLEGAWSLSQ